MVYSAFRYLSIGAVSITAVLLLALTVLRDPDAVLTRLGASVASNRPLTGSDAGLIVERASTAPRAVFLGAAGSRPPVANRPVNAGT